MEPQEIAERIQAYIQSKVGAYSEGALEVETDYLEEVERDDYMEALDQVMDTYEVPAEMREGVYEQLDAEGDYSEAGFIKHLEVVINDEDVSTVVENNIDNGVTVEHGAEVHGDVYQASETNVATASGDGAIAGGDQDGQFQTGDGVQSNDNSGVVNQGDNSGQQAGWDTTAEDITTGDGNFNNEGTINDSAIAFGEGDATNEANDVYDASTNDSYNTEDSLNTNDSFDTEGSFNHEATATTTTDVDAHLDADVHDSFNSDDDYKDIDHTEVEEGADYMDAE